jgi:hypothetical protein
MTAVLPDDRGFLSASGSGLGITCPVALEMRTLVPSSKYLLEIFVGSLQPIHIV